MTKEITIAVVSSVLGALIAFLGSSAIGLFEKTISASQIQEVAKSLVDVDKHRDVLLDRMERSGRFNGPKGDPGLKGPPGPPGPQGPGAKVLAMVTVKDGQIESKSGGVSYDSASGIVTFPNPENLRFVALVSDVGGAYITETHFLRKDFAAPDKFKVWRKPLDTSNKNGPPDSVTPIAVGVQRTE